MGPVSARACAFVGMLLCSMSFAQKAANVLNFCYLKKKQKTLLSFHQTISQSSEHGKLLHPRDVWPQQGGDDGQSWGGNTGVCLPPQWRSCCRRKEEALPTQVRTRVCTLSSSEVSFIQGHLIYTNTHVYVCVCFNLPQCRFPWPEEAQQLHGRCPDPSHVRPLEGQDHPQWLDPGPVHPDRGGQPRAPLHQDRGDGGWRRGELRGQAPFFTQCLIFLKTGEEKVSLLIFFLVIRCLLSSLCLWSRTDTTATTLAQWSIPLTLIPPRFNLSFACCHISMNSLWVLQGFHDMYILLRTK